MIEVGIISESCLPQPSTSPYPVFVIIRWRLEHCQSTHIKLEFTSSKLREKEWHSGLAKIRNIRSCTGGAAKYLNIDILEGLQASEWVEHLNLDQRLKHREEECNFAIVLTTGRVTTGRV
jgi:hypothetical protein